MKYFIVPALLFLAGCASQPLTPEKDSIKVGREKPNKECKDLGKVTGTTISVKGTAEQALDDMKKLAASKGATYVQVLQYSDTGTTVTGNAFQCM